MFVKHTQWICFSLAGVCWQGFVLLRICYSDCMCLRNWVTYVNVSRCFFLLKIFLLVSMILLIKHIIALLRFVLLKQLLTTKHFHDNLHCIFKEKKAQKRLSKRFSMKTYLCVSFVLTLLLAACPDNVRHNPLTCDR